MNIKNQFLISFCTLLLGTHLNAFEVKIKVFLEGPFSGSFMHTHLAGELKKNHSQTPSDAGDIVNVEIRTSLQGNAIETKKAFVLKDGSLVDYNTLQPTITFSASGNAYFVVVKHRNHLPLASKQLVTHQSICDLTMPQNVFGEYKKVNSVAVMIAGNVHDDAGNVNEINATDFWMVSKAKDDHLNGYVQADVNLDGLVNEIDFQIVKANAEKLYFSQIQ